ncbi:dihydrofolate reductase family protein [Saccharopolyspora griseoalba]|uniref:Dihydrofolate reductase family protein n=1 Tax=Saccharopolyspora griseoalba TaxID=1431848 RepID=A0ABW2LCW1_9PSEU
MRSITATVFVTLDGVVQGLGRADEDTRGGFAHGGWGLRYDDEVMARSGDLLFGRSTREDFREVWGRARDGNPFSARMNAATKYVVSRPSPDVGSWQDSVLLAGEAVETVAELTAPPGRDLSINGSASLVRGLHAVGLIDRLTFLIRPVTLGSGRRLFEGPAPRPSSSSPGASRPARA